MLKRLRKWRRRRRITVGADKAYDTADHVAALRQLGVTPHVARNDSEAKTGKWRHSAIDGRITRHSGYKVSQSRRVMIDSMTSSMAATKAALASGGKTHWFWR